MKTAPNKDTEGAIIAQFDGWPVGWNVRLPQLPALDQESKVFLEGGHAVIEVFTTRQECDGTENVSDSDAWPNRLRCTDCGVALWVVTPPFIVLQLKGSFIMVLRNCTVCSFWSGKARNKNYISKVPADTLAKLKMLCDGRLKKYVQI